MEKNCFLSFVGSNPVPVYVAAKYLTTANRNDIDSLPLVEKILFIHSNDTENNCTQTKKVLDLPQECFFSMSIGTVDKTRSPSAIRQCIIEMLDRFVSNMDSIIFCYTAGTKPMSVFGYNTVQEYCLKHNKQFYYCDLDPNNYKIIAGNPNEESERLIPYEGNLLDKVKIELENLLLIQNIIKRKEKESKDEISISRKIIEESYFFNKEQVFINLYESLMSESHELESLIKDLDRRSIFKRVKNFPLKKDKDFINGMPKLTN